ncbi:hypothetical protein FGG08_005718 [Glutinoglossum americanum]|uniref:DUF3835 domain-containing protein n=1 Tax=Glutinoglossum americanum TaxID=1670608 RepID=A0A9P8I6Q8_9PEZI|nr:hypothetical protein FGG08_005718 [Glutinoglossum americanum]
MALPMKDSFADLERHRLRLEDNVSKLRKALRHWQTWEAEYEGLKEEIQAFDGDPQPEDLIAIGKNFGGTVVTEKEIKELLGDGQNARRSALQVENMLSRRIEYAQKNAKTVEKQLQIAEDKLNSIIVISKPDVRNEEGLPIMEIREELDDDGNVISWGELINTSASSATAPSDSTPQVIEALRKAGVTDLGAIGHAETSKKRQVESAKSEASQANGRMNQFHVDGNAELEPKTPVAPQPDSMGTVPPDPKLYAQKKRVTFVEDNKEEGQQLSSDYKGLNKASKRPAIQRQGADSGRITEATENEEKHPTPLVPVDESPGDAAIRREMLNYAFSEVGPIVAELDLEEDFYSDDYDEDDDDEDQETSSVEEEEDKFGRTTRRVVDDKYRKEMEALERKLNARMMENVGPRPNGQTLGGIAEDPRQQPGTHTISPKPAPDERKKPAKKGVRFAEELDISPAPRIAASNAASDTSDPQPPLEESVFERGPMAGGPAKPVPSKARKISKFKSSHVPSSSTANQSSNSAAVQGSANDGRSPSSNLLNRGVVERRVPALGPSLPLIPVAATKTTQFSSPIVLHEEQRAAPEGPPGKTLSDGIIERFTTDRDVEPPDPDGLDPTLLHQEVAVEYHKMRNRMIQREGGFMPREEELERVPLTEEEGGSGKKVSRFKAARLGKRVSP